MGCGMSTMNNQVAPMFEVDNSSKTTVSKKSYLAGKFPREELPKDVWKSRMTTFIQTNISQMKEYGRVEHAVMMRRLADFERTTDLRICNNDKHIHAIMVIRKLFNLSASTNTMCDTLLEMSLDYCQRNKEHDFEEIMFAFTIIVNAPMLKYFEAKY